MCKNTFPFIPTGNRCYSIKKGKVEKTKPGGCSDFSVSRILISSVLAAVNLGVSTLVGHLDCFISEWFPTAA